MCDNCADNMDRIRFVLDLDYDTFKFCSKDCAMEFYEREMLIEVDEEDEEDEII